MMRVPVLPTIIVAAVVATLIGLGVWQLQRAEWKKHLLARYDVAANLPPVAWPAVPGKGEDLYFRKASGFCLEVTAWRPTAGRNLKGDSGWSFVASCRTGAEGPGMQVDMGWSQQSTPPKGWRGGEVRGVIAPDAAHQIRLISSTPAPGFEASEPPSPATIPNNHLFYAFQWFFFAAAAAVIYVLALRRRQARASEPPKA
jgi:cytochrome oxidase assembly protein ShyY1